MALWSCTLDVGENATAYPVRVQQCEGENKVYMRQGWQMCICARTTATILRYKPDQNMQRQTHV